MQIDIDAPPTHTMSHASSIAEHLQNSSQLVWNVEKLRNDQLEILTAIFDPSNETKQLIVQPTARGKNKLTS